MKKFFLGIILLTIIISCENSVKNKIEANSRIKVGDEKIGYFRIQKDWKKEERKNFKECFVSSDNSKSICYNYFSANPNNKKDISIDEAFENFIKKYQNKRKKDFNKVNVDEKNKNDVSFTIIKSYESKKMKNVNMYEKIYYYDGDINIITILGIFEDMTEFDNYIEALENTHKLPD